MERQIYNFLLTGLLAWYPAIQNTVVVGMILSAHGMPQLFLLAAILGTIAFIFLATLVPVNRVLTFVGENTLSFLGLNGAFVEFINKPVAQYINPSENFIYIMFISIVGTIASMLVSYPFIVLFNKFVHQLVGKRRPSLKWKESLLAK